MGLSLLPTEVQYMLTGVVHRSAASGIERDFVELLLAAIPRGVSFSTCCEMYNQVQRTSQARREHGHYASLAAQVASASVKMGQVGYVQVLLCAVCCGHIDLPSS